MRAWPAVFAASCLPSAAHGTAIYRHGWATVADVMGMHGKFKSADALPSDAAVAFVAEHYGMVTTGSGCPKTSHMTLEDATLSVAARIKAINPQVKVGMYWRTGMDKEIAQCSNASAALKAHGTGLFLRDDKGTLVSPDALDYSNKDARAFFADVLLNVVKQTLSSGQPAVDYVYLDGAGGSATQFAPGIGPARSVLLLADKMAWLADLQRQFDAVEGGRNVILNGVDVVSTARQFNPTGVAGVMIDHWSILEFLLRGPTIPKEDFGKFNTTTMDAGFDLARSDALSNMTVQVKGWVGPIIHQKDRYPPGMTTPSTPAEKQQVSGERFNSELALFLLVAEDRMYWMYSWFWGFDDYVPDELDSTVPQGFFPQAKCTLGAPAGPPTRVQGTWTYTREYAHASVFVDLNNRTASRVDFKGSC